MSDPGMPNDATLLGSGDGVRSEGEVTAGDPLGTTGRSGKAPAVAPGTMIGESFRIERTLGAGAMGVVFEATDLSLDRKVAIKLHTSSGEQRSLRMLREAKAMAQLSHPNVIAVHEVGRFEGRVFIAMELVDGGTVRDWLATPRSWREVVGVFVQAGRGLAAAHRVGLIHRDFKPDNMLIGSDGRVRVADFGLARAADDANVTSSRDPVRVASELAGSGSLDERLTRTGAMVGTPAYMPPEQLASGSVDARVDQFAFCVALHEALYGQRPFAGNSVPEVVAAAALGEIREPPPDRSVPGWVRAVVVRGVAARPEDRFPDMDAVVAALEANPWRRRRRVGLAVGAVAAVVATAWISRSTASDRCRDAAAVVADTWNDDVAGRVDDGLRGASSPLAAEAADRAVPALATYAARLADARVDACRATQREGQSEAILALRMACYERQQMRLDAAIDLLSDEPGADVVEHALDVAASLGSLRACEDVDELTSRVPLPEDRAAAGQIRQLERRAASLHAAHLAGRSRWATEEIGPVLEQAQDLDYAPLLADLYTLQAALFEGQREPAEIRGALASAYRYAVAGGSATAARDIAAMLAVRIGDRPTGYEDASYWLEAAEGWQTRQPHDDAAGRAALLSAEASVLFFADRYPEALDAIERAGAELDRTVDTPARTRDRIELLMRRGQILHRLARLEDARAVYDEAVAAAEEQYGSDHPRVAWLLEDAARVEAELAGPDAAIEMTRRAERIVRAVYGERSRARASNLTKLAGELHRAGHLVEAVETYDEALSILGSSPGDTVAQRAIVMSNMSGVLRELGNDARAAELAESAVALGERAWGYDSLKAAEARMNYAAVLGNLGRNAEALAAFEASRTTLIAAYGPVHPNVLLVELNIAQAARSADDIERSHRALDRATELVAQLDHDSPLTRARIEAARANTYDGQPGHATDAIAHGERALALYEAHAKESAELDRLLYHQAVRILDSGDRARGRAMLRRAADRAVQRGVQGTLPARIRLTLSRSLAAERAGRAEALRIAQTAVAQLEAEGSDDSDTAEVLAEARAWVRELGGDAAGPGATPGLGP